ncbi:hypothetical protein HanXRQr2_Chr02g0056251 [Helianthus annuus]|uniref:Uncharacterized protein n=1 Tax=Helianthus annuus TaxID=4232 RepID=A0A9K3JMM9_HELAN|nr:hypothetical protein HanXRQr2_Chr02g0056251 [Helianthus annuus]KAJ0614566.1 hypothetical protein HanIR_Chr02g0063881 [Helianthus annuus]
MMRERDRDLFLPPIHHKIRPPTGLITVLRRMDQSSVIQVNLQLSWASSGKQDVEDYNGWVFGEESVGSKRQTKGLPTFVLFDIGSSVVALLMCLLI